MPKTKIIYRNNEENILGEKNILSKIHNPFIVNMYFSFQDSDNLYLIMDLLSGGDLRYHINIKKSYPFNENQTKFFISNIIIALEYIHNQKIVHRDIKPENLLLDRNGYLRLTDFGIAMINNNENIKNSSGTVGYMAPEVILRQGHSYSADFFALGVIGYEIMLGHRPYYGRNRKQLKDLILAYQAKIKFNKLKRGWSDNSRDFINKLIQRRPAKRLGYEGINEIKNHIWLKDINWDLMKNKKVKAPYIPQKGTDNFDKRFCLLESIDEKYKNIININQYDSIFENFTYINLNYVSQLKKNNNCSKEKELKKNVDQIPFSENRKSSSTYKNHNKSTFQLNKKYFDSHFTNKRYIRNIESKENSILSSCQSQKNFHISTSQLIPNEKNKNLFKSRQKNINKKVKKENSSIENLKKEKKHINLKDIHNLVLKSIISSPIFQKVISDNSTNNNKSCQNCKSKTKSKKNKIINYKKTPINKGKQKEKKEFMFNSTTTVDIKDKNLIRSINQKLKNNINNNKSKSVNQKDNENKSNNRKKNKEIIIQNQYFIYNKNISFILNSNNKILKKEKSKINQKIIINPKDIKNNIFENNNIIRVNNLKDSNIIISEDKKDFQINNNIDNKNDLRNSINKKNSLNKKDNSLSEAEKNINIKSSRNLTILKKYKKLYGHKSNKMYDSKGFNEFKEKIKNFKKQKMHKSLSCEKLKNKKEIKANVINNDKIELRTLKFDDYFKNTRLDKDSKKNNYYIIDKFLSI